MQKDEKNTSGHHSHDHMLHKLWNEEVKEMPDAELRKALDTFRDNRNAHDRRRLRKLRIVSIMKYAALFVVPLITAWAAWNYSAEYYAEENDMVQCYVPKGKIDSLRLSDNTKVIVNAGTSVIYPSSFSKHNVYRNVYVNGSCHFAVTKDPRHPFVVNMGGLKVKVLGTQFSVDSYNEEDKVTVTLEEGLVKVFDKHRSMTLYPNEQLVYSKSDGSMTKSRVDALACNSWVSGNMNFSDHQLSEMLAILERRYNVKFRVASGVDVNRRYTMNFKKDEPIENVLKVLSIASGNIRYRKTGSTITLY